MKTKKHLIAIAIFGSMLFLAEDANTYSLDEAALAKIEKKKREIPCNG